MQRTNKNNLQFDFDITDSSYAPTPEPAAAVTVMERPEPTSEPTPEPSPEPTSEPTKDPFTRQREIWNKQARQMAYFLEREKMQPAGAGRKMLKRYTGQGGILTSQESKGQYLTPYGICRMLTELIEARPGARVFDPTCGTGRFAEYLPDGCEFTGIEIDKTAAKIGQLLYPSATIEHGDILDNLHFKERFDIVMGNPPFGLWWKVDPKKSNVASAAGKVLSQWKILEASIIAVKKGGILGLVIPRNTFKNDRAADNRAAEFWNSNCIVRAEIDLPPRAFKSSGTTWPCSVVILQRPPATAAPRFKYEIQDIKAEYSTLIEQFKYSEAFRWMKAGAGGLLKNRRAKKKAVVINKQFKKEKEKFEYVFSGNLSPDSESDIAYIKRAGHNLSLKPNGVIAALKLEEWKQDATGYYDAAEKTWQKKCTIDQLVLRDNISGFSEVGLDIEIDPEFLLYLKGKRKFYRKENIKMSEIPEKRPRQYARNMDMLKQLGIWDRLFPFQRHDAAIHAIKNFSFIAYEQRLGKTRTAAAAVLLKGTQTNLIICFSRLIKTWHKELTHPDPDEGLGIDPADVKIITKPSHLDNLWKFNIISFEVLRKQDRKTGVVECEKCGSEVKGKVCMAPNPDPYGERKTCGWNRFKDATCPACGDMEIPTEEGVCIHDDLYTGRYCHRCGYSEAVWKPGIYKRMRHLFSCIVVDESQASKNRNSQQGRALRTLKAKHKIILTGTIIENYISEAFWQLYWLLGASCRFPYPFEGGHSMFLKRFCEFTKTKTGRMKMLPAIKNEEIFYEMMDSLMTRRTRNDEKVRESIDFKDYEESRIKIEPTKGEKDLYEQALNDFENWYMDQLTRLDEIPYWLQGESKKKLSAAVLVKLNALRRVSSCPFEYNGYDRRQLPAKLKFVRGIVEQKLQAGRKVLISSAFKPVISYMINKLPNCEGFTGEMPIPKRNIIMERFQKEAEPQVLAVTTQCCNLGVDLSKASTMIIYDLLWSPKQLEQMWKRIDGPRQKNEFEILFLINQEMIDVDINDLIVKKDAAINKAIDRIESDVDTELFSPLDFANKLLSGRGSSWIKKYMN